MATPTPKLKEAPPELRKMIEASSPPSKVDEIVKAREGIYGHPYDNFANIADFWMNYIRIRHKVEVTLSREDIAHMMILFKVARSINQVHDADTIDDICGYAKCIHLIRERESGAQSNV